MNSQKKYPAGYITGLWMGICIALFSGFGVPLSMVTGNYGLIGIGPAIGVALGVSFGAAFEAKYIKEGRIRPLNDTERKKRKLISTTGIILLCALFLIILTISILNWL